jgi:RHS repeat-associated protein
VQKIGAGLYAPSTVATIDAATGNSPLSRSIAFNARFAYDEQGRLIGEYAPDGKLISETIWFNDLPIATLRPKGSNAGTPLGITGTTTGNPANGATATNANNVGTNTTANKVNVEIFYIHPDHLGTPRVVTRSTIATGANAPSSATANSPGAINKATWRRESDPFGTLLGNSAPNENPQIITGTATQVQAATFIYDEMFPGQHRDRESGKFYNYFRDYDAQVGRYTASDPIGLRGGLSTFLYVGANPVVNVDPLGLCKPGPRMKQCLDEIFGRDVGFVNVEVDPPMVERHLGPGVPGAVTRPGVIYISMSCEKFWGGLPWFILHEYYHVLIQWGDQGMSRLGYLLEARKKEDEAQAFALKNQERLKKCLSCDR